MFVYDALLDALKSGNTSMKCSTFRDDYKMLLEIDKDTGKSQLQVQFETLQSMCPVVKHDDCASGLQAENQDKNRNTNILPGKIPTTKPHNKYVYWVKVGKIVGVF